MNLRARLSLQWLEARENPSGPAPIDPIGDPYAPPQDPQDPALTQPPETTTQADPPADPSDPYTDVNEIYNQPISQYP